ncbi:hypothetical protein NIES4102_33020 [Chondrocystis sp. NIES-4102]|nr:hypothetical protein NIES4102_33020 [Chondrocystis sp. NIES-4102]
MRAEQDNYFIDHFERQPQQFTLPTYNFSPQRVTKFLLFVIAGLIILNLGERIYVRWYNANNEIQIISKYFNFDQEHNVPSLYSGLSLGFCSFLLAIITDIKKATRGKYVKHWRGLSLIFLFLAIDEIFSIHEATIPFFRNAINGQGVLYFSWIVPAFFLLIVFLLSYRKFIFNLPTRTKTLLVLAGMTYISGTLGMELIGGYIADNYGYKNSIYGIASTIEELLEMFGVVIFVYGLLDYIKSQFRQLQFSLSLEGAKNKYIGD